MNCQQTRHRVLAVEDPNRIPEDLFAHLRGCANCQAWQRQYARLDLLLARLPAYASGETAKAALLEKIRSLPQAGRNAPDIELAAERSPALEAPARPLAAGADPSSGVGPKFMRSKLDLDSELSPNSWSFGRHAAKFWPAGLVAATLLIGTIAWLSLRGDRLPAPDPTPADPLLNNLVKLNVELAKTQTPGERVKLLAQVADELNQEMRDIARADATGENMQALEDMYRRVVLDGLYDQAKLVERTQREVILGKVAEGLAQSARSADEMAEKSPQHSATSLHEAANTAREGTKRIRRLIREALS